MEDLVRQHLDAGRRHEAFELLVEWLQHKVFRLAFTLLRDEGLAEDAAQDAFLRVWRALPQFEGRSSLSTWVYTITRNVCLTRVRKLASESRAEVFGAGAEFEPAIDRSAMDLERALCHLPEKYRQVLELFYFEEKSCEAVAQMLGMPMATVKTHLHRARKQLREVLEKQHDVPEGACLASRGQL